MSSRQVPVVKSLEAEFPSLKAYISNGFTNGHSIGHRAPQPAPVVAAPVDPDMPEEARRLGAVRVSGGGETVYVAIVTITPEMALEWSGRIGKEQRDRKFLHWRMIVEDIRAGFWTFNGETVLFDSHGNLIDGQHRVLALIEAAKQDPSASIVSLVVWGIDPAAYASLGASAKRSGPDALKVINVDKYRKAIAGAARMLVRYENDMMRTHRMILSPMAVSRTFSRHEALTDAATIAKPAARVCRSEVVPVFCCYLFLGIDSEAAREFMDKLGSGLGLSEGSPIHAYRRYLTNRVPDADDNALLLTKAWNSWRKGISVDHLKLGDQERFPDPI